MHMELTENEMALLSVLLQKELEDTRVEFHHSKNHEYKAMLTARENLVREFTQKVEKARAASS